MDVSGSHFSRPVLYRLEFYNVTDLGTSADISEISNVYKYILTSVIRSDESETPIRFPSCQRAAQMSHSLIVQVGLRNNMDLPVERSALRSRFFTKRNGEKPIF